MKKILNDLESLTSALYDIYDVRNALSEEVKNQPKDSDGTDITIGDCLDDVITFLEAIDEEGRLHFIHPDNPRLAFRDKDTQKHTQ